MASTSRYEHLRIASRYSDWLRNHGKEVTPLFTSLTVLAKELDSKAKAAEKRPLYQNEATLLKQDAEACREEATRLREVAGIPMRPGWSSAGNISGRDENGKPITKEVGSGEPTGSSGTDNTT